MRGGQPQDSTQNLLIHQTINDAINKFWEEKMAGIPSASDIKSQIDAAVEKAYSQQVMEAVTKRVDKLMIKTKDDIERLVGEAGKLAEGINSKMKSMRERIIAYRDIVEDMEDKLEKIRDEINRESVNDYEESNDSYVDDPSHSSLSDVIGTTTAVDQEDITRIQRENNELLRQKQTSPSFPSSPSFPKGRGEDPKDRGDDTLSQEPPSASRPFGKESKRYKIVPIGTPALTSQIDSTDAPPTPPKKTMGSLLGDVADFTSSVIPTDSNKFEMNLPRENGHCCTFDKGLTKLYNQHLDGQPYPQIDLRKVRKDGICVKCMNNLTYVVTIGRTYDDTENVRSRNALKRDMIYVQPGNRLVDELQYLRGRVFGEKTVSL